MMPIIVCIIAALLLKEKVTVMSYVMIIFITSSVLMVILGAKGSEKEVIQTDWVAVVCLIA